MTKKHLIKGLVGLGIVVVALPILLIVGGFLVGFVKGVFGV